MSIEVLLPPYIVPQAEQGSLIDDSTSVFRPTQAPGFPQRVSFVEPRLQFKQSWKALRLNERGAMHAALKQVQGRFGTIRALVGYFLRGSFPTTEYLTNNTFANGATGWSAYFGETLTVDDRALRATRTANDAAHGQGFSTTSTVGSLTQYVPYVVRAVWRDGRGSFSSNLIRVGTSIGDNSLGEATYSDGRHLLSCAFVPNSVAAVYPQFVMGGNISGALAGDYFDCPWISLTRCALIDDAVNALLRSDEFDNAAWTKQAVTVSANLGGAPDSTTTADGIFETTATNDHFVQQNITTVAAAADYTFAVALRAGAIRSWVRLQLNESAGPTAVTAYVNVSTGAVGTIANGAGWANGRVSVTSLGGGWFYFALTGRKTSASTTLTAYILHATADNASTNYAGNASAFYYAWRATFSQSSVAKRLVQTTSTIVNPNPQTGSGLYLKGLPASTNGLLLLDDPFEINGELKFALAPLNSDAAGLAYLPFAPALVRSPADNDPVVIANPMGKFILGGSPQWTNQFGQYSDLDLGLETINE